ncbi:hypothetical protein KY289_016807 [Solanum tuberosum]|nr:hypothetical protein KY289_016807 [Solanum tuberosum]
MCSYGLIEFDFDKYLYRSTTMDKTNKDHPQIISSDNCQDTTEESSKSVKGMYENIMQERIAYFRKEQEQLKKYIYRRASQDQTNKE